MTARPLAVLLGRPASLTPVQILTAAADTQQVLFVLDEGATGAHAEQLRLVAEALAPTISTDFADPARSAEVIRDAGAGSVTTFTDRLCPLATAIRAHLDPAGGHQLWLRKDQVRARLVEAGVSQVRSAVLDSPEQTRTLMDQWGSGLVVKPVDGAASLDTWLLRTPADVDEFIAAHQRRDETGPRLAEEYIRGIPRERTHLGDYVSVEVIRLGPGAQVRLTFVTDRGPLAAPCRESALIWPSTLPEGTQARLVATADAALDVLGAGRGSYHVELKPGLDRDEIIEVNGRLGGFTARAAGYGSDVDLARLALDIATGEKDHQPAAITWHQCVAVLLFPAPQAARRIARAPERRSLARRPGVLAIDALRGVGQECTWQHGTDDAVATLWLAGADHDELRERFLDTAEFLHQEIGFVDEQGRSVNGNGWLDRLHGQNEPIP